MRLLTIVIICAVICFVCPLGAKADAVDFNVAKQSGGFIWGGGTAVTASTAGVPGDLTAQRIGTPPGVTSILAGSVMSFTTGAYLGVFNIFGNTGHSFDKGGSVTVTGCGGTCFSGTFTAAQLLFDAASGGYSFTGNYIDGVLSGSLLAALGFPAGTPTGGSGFITANFVPDGTIAGKYNWASGDLTITPVPEPSTLSLFGVGLLGLALVTKKLALR